MQARSNIYIILTKVISRILWTVCHYKNSTSKKSNRVHSPFMTYCIWSPMETSGSISGSKSWTIQNPEHQEEVFALEKSCCIVYSAALKFLLREGNSKPNINNAILVLMSLSGVFLYVGHTYIFFPVSHFSVKPQLGVQGPPQTTGNSQESTLGNDICLTKSCFKVLGIRNYFEVKTTACIVIFYYHWRRCKSTLMAIKHWLANPI